MIRVAVALFIVGFACLGIGNAGSILPFPAYTGNGGSGPAYVGLGDITTFTVYGDLRAMTAAIAAAGTQPLIHITRASDTHSCDVLVASSGGLGNTANCGTGGDNGQTASGFCAATVCRGYNYDQTRGNACAGASCDWNDNANGSLGTFFPTLTFNCYNSVLPCWTSTGSTSQLMRTSNNFTPSTRSQSYLMVINSTDSSSAGNFPLEQNGPSNFFKTTNNTITYFGGNSGSLAATATDSQWHSEIAAIDLTPSTSTFNVDGTETTSTSINNNTAADLIYAARATNAPASVSLTTVAFTDNTVWSLALRSKMCANITAYSGITPGTHCNPSGT